MPDRRFDPRYDRAPTPGYYGGGGGGNRIADLIYQSGRDQAENTLRSGETFANSLAGLGQIFAPAFAARKAKKDEAKVQAAIQQGVAPGEPGMDMDAEGNPTEARPRSSNMFDAIKGLPPELRSRAMQGIQKWREEDSKRQEHDLKLQELQQKIDETKTAKQQRAADQLAGGAKSTLDMFDTPRGAVVAVNGFHSAAKGSGLVDDRLDTFVSGVNDAWQAAQGDPKREAMFLDALKTQGSPILQTLMQRGSPEWQKANKPEVSQVDVTNPDGSKTVKLVEKKAGQTFESAATPPKPGTEEAFIIGRYGRNPTPEQALKGRAEYAAAGRNPGDDAAPTLSGPALDMTANLYAQTGTLPPMGMGKAGATVRQAIINRAAELNPDANIAQNKASYGADTGSLKKLQAQTDAVSAFESTAAANSKILDDVLKRTPDIGAKFLNKPLRAIEGQLGSEDVAAFNTIRQSVQNEYARIISNPNLSGTMSDSARKEAETLLSPDATVGQIRAALKILKAEAANRHKSYQDQIGTIKGRMSGKKTDADPLKLF